MVIRGSGFAAGEGLAFSTTQVSIGGAGAAAPCIVVAGNSSALECETTPAGRGHIAAVAEAINAVEVRSQLA